MEQVYIFKFGGSCFKNKESMNQSLKILDYYAKKGKIVAVTSAFYGITNQLLNWLGYSSSKKSADTSLIELNKIKQYHDNIVIDMIADEQIKQETIFYLHKKFENLEKLIPELINQKEENLELTDNVLSYGERLSTFIYTQFLKNKGYNVEFVSSDDKFIYTNNIFGNALPLLDKIDEVVLVRINNIFAKGAIPIISGYYGSTLDGRITTLGRGGTDFTATIIGYALGEHYDTTVIFWKDVNGLLSADPKYESHAKLVEQISFKEAKELAYFGSKIMHPLCLNTAEMRNSKVELRNYDDPFNEKYTIITNNPIEQASVIKAITTLEKIAMVTIEGESMVSLPGVAAKIFSIMAENNINVNFISQGSSENNITFGVTDADGFKAVDVLSSSEYFGSNWLRVNVDHDVSLIAVVGEGMHHKTGIAGKVFSALGNSEVNIIAIAQGSSELNITFVVHRSDLTKAIRKLYHTFIEEQTSHNGNGI